MQRPLDIRILCWRDALSRAAEGRPVWLERYGFDGRLMDDKPVVPKRHGNRVWFGTSSLPIGKPGDPLAGMLVRNGLVSVLDTRPTERVYFCCLANNERTEIIALFPERPADAGGQHVLAYVQGGYKKALYSRVVGRTEPVPDNVGRNALQREIELFEGFEIIPITDPKDFSPKITKRRAKELIQ